MEKLNFNRYAKNEILENVPTGFSECKAWLSAAVKAIGSLRILKNKTELIFESLDYDYIKSLTMVIQSLYNSELDIDVTSVNTGIQKGRMYTLKAPSGISDSILRDTSIIYDTKEGYSFTAGIPNVIVKNIDDAKSYLKSLFIAVGSAGVPEKLIGEDNDIESSGSGYYLEFILADDEYAESVIKLLSIFDINAKMVERSNKFVVYVKEGEIISNFFALLSASETVLYMQDIILERMLNNNVNRKSNCEVANMDKTAIASSKQMLAIDTIDELYGLKRLNEDLYELAMLRRDNPTATLDYLAEKQGVSKSCINHRFRKLISMADELKTKEGKTE